MNNIRVLAIALLIPFAALTVYTVLEVGYIEIFDYQRHSPAGWQVFADLGIALILVLCWLIPDARKAGRNPWPWVVMMPFLGSLSPLLYLATGSRQHTQVNSGAA
jgi:hypothetical protein